MLKLEEAIGDSPMFRQKLKMAEIEINSRFEKLKRINRACMKVRSSTEALKSDWLLLSAEFQSFIENPTEEEDNLENCFYKCGDVLKSIEEYRVIQLENLNRNFIERIEKILNCDSPHVKECYRKFENLSLKLNQVLAKHSQIPKSSSKSKAVIDELVNAKTEFRSSSFELVSTVNELNFIRKLEIQELALNLMQSQALFFNDTSSLLQTLESRLFKWNQLINDQKQKYSVEIKDLESRKSVMITSSEIPIPSAMPTPVTSPETEVTFEEVSEKTAVPSIAGYLFIFEKGMRPGGGLWKRRFFAIHEGKISYCKDAKSINKDPNALIELAVATVKLVPQKVTSRDFCFEVVSPYKVFVLQAENQEDVERWVKGIQEAIQLTLSQPILPLPPANAMVNTPKKRKSTRNRASNKVDVEASPRRQLDKAKRSNYDRSRSLSAISSNVPKKPNHILTNQKFLHLLKTLDEANSKCADCKRPDPEWTSINFGVLICIECSGFHRSLGTHISKVRSLILDTLDREVLKLIEHIGNTAANQIFESELPSDYIFDPQLREEFIQQKYVKKAFVPPYHGMNKEADMQYFTKQGRITSVLKLIAQGADIDFKYGEKGLTPLHVATKNKDGILMALLIQNGANLNISNSEGKTPLHVSAAKSLVESTAILLKYGSDESRKDNEGKTPLDYAMETEHADSVTLLRLAKLAREEKGEFTTTLLEAVSDIEINFDIRPVHTIKITKEPMTQVPSSPQLPTTSDLISSDTPSTGSRKLPRKERSQGNSILLKYADLMEKMTQEVGENSMQAWGSASQPKAHISSFECIDEGDSFDMLLNEELRKLDADYQPPEGEPKEGELEDEFEEVSETPQRRVIGDRKMKSKQVKNNSPFSQSSPNLPNLPKPPASTRSVRKDTSVLPPIPPTPPSSDPASAFGATTDRSQRDEDKTGPSHRDDKPFRTSSFLKKEYKREENFAESRNKSLDRQNFLRRSPSASKSEKKM